MEKRKIIRIKQEKVCKTLIKLKHYPQENVYKVEKRLSNSKQIAQKWLYEIKQFKNLENATIYFKEIKNQTLREKETILKSEFLNKRWGKYQTSVFYS